ncbi:MAG: hypothetical protein IPN82_16030 [Chitinophagaceae bacterium]|nr:hypothetical protein [Chitinophagaceae bacterium]
MPIISITLFITTTNLQVSQKLFWNNAALGVAATNITKLERIYVLKACYSMKLGLGFLLNFNIDLSKQYQQFGMALCMD